MNLAKLFYVMRFLANTIYESLRVNFKIHHFINNHFAYASIFND